MGEFNSAELIKSIKGKVEHSLLLYRECWGWRERERSPVEEDHLFPHLVPLAVEVACAWNVH